MCGKAYAVIQVILFILTLHPLCPTLPRKTEPGTASSQPGGQREEEKERQAILPCFGAVSLALPSRKVPASVTLLPALSLQLQG